MTVTIPATREVVEELSGAGLLPHDAAWRADGLLEVAPSFSESVRAFIDAGEPERRRSARIAEQHRERVAVEFERRIGAVLGSPAKQASIAREGLALLLQSKARRKLGGDQVADLDVIAAINAWESAMIETREALTASGETSYADDTHWPPPPAEVTPAWLAGF